METWKIWEMGPFIPSFAILKLERRDVLTIIMVVVQLERLHVHLIYNFQSLRYMQVSNVSLETWVQWEYKVKISKHYTIWKCIYEVAQGAEQVTVQEKIFGQFACKWHDFKKIYTYTISMSRLVVLREFTSSKKLEHSKLHGTGSLVVVS